MKDLLGIIPARFRSTRFPGKPLAFLGNKPMVQWVYERASMQFDNLLVATDDERIVQAVEAFGGRVLLTSTDHRTGTERCAEALQLEQDRSGRIYRYVVNIQGDEPLVDPQQLEALSRSLQEGNAPVTTLIRPIREEREFRSPHVVKVVVDQHFKALYFSRAAIPYRRDLVKEGAGENSPTVACFAHVGLYGFTSEILKKIVELPPSSLEMAESLEQLRWMEAGIPIFAVVTDSHSMGVDTPEDLEELQKRI